MERALGVSGSDAVWVEEVENTCCMKLRAWLSGQRRATVQFRACTVSGRGQGGREEGRGSADGCRL